MRHLFFYVPQAAIMTGRLRSLRSAFGLLCTFDPPPPSFPLSFVLRPFLLFSQLCVYIRPPSIFYIYYLPYCLSLVLQLDLIYTRDDVDSPVPRAISPRGDSRGIQEWPTTSHMKMKSYLSPASQAGSITLLTGAPSTGAMNEVGVRAGHGMPVMKSDFPTDSAIFEVTHFESHTWWQVSLPGR